eukprot:1146695-Pelagomonas_calceolata.AAC.5
MLASLHTSSQPCPSKHVYLTFPVCICSHPIHQEEITSLICEAVESTLSNSNTSRTLATLKAPLATPNATMAGFIPRPSQTQMSESTQTLHFAGRDNKAAGAVAGSETVHMLPASEPDHRLLADLHHQSLVVGFLAGPCYWA